MFGELFLWCDMTVVKCIWSESELWRSFSPHRVRRSELLVHVCWAGTFLHLLASTTMASASIKPKPYRWLTSKQTHNFISYYFLKNILIIFLGMCCECGLCVSWLNALIFELPLLILNVYTFTFSHIKKLVSYRLPQSIQYKTEFINFITFKRTQVHFVIILHYLCYFTLKYILYVMRVFLI